jgi:hypothetical protein
MRTAAGLGTLVLCVLLLCGAPAFAQQSGEYYHEVLPDGTVQFTQVLHWDGDSNAWCYEVTVQTTDGADVISTRVTEPSLRLTLGPGNYRYRIVYYNLLHKPEVELPWQEFEIVKAEMPAVRQHAPTSCFLEDADPRLSLTGERLLRGMTVALRPEAGGAGAVSGVEVARDGSEAVSLSFPASSLDAGRYSLVTTNPGGLSQTVADALVVRHKLPLAAGLFPAPGTDIGPKDLRAARSITFAWNTVPGAASYIFCLYREGETQPFLRNESLAECSFVLDDLTILDRGGFRWTVEARGIDADGTVIPAVGVAEARFQIDLPRLATPVVRGGDAFYGG